MVPFDVVARRDDVVCNSGGVTILCKSFEMLSFPIMQSAFRFTDIERITVPTTSFVYYFRPLRTVKTIFVWKERLNPASVLKNNPKIDKSIKLANTKFNKTRINFALET